jgi:hypothetical protein
MRRALEVMACVALVSSPSVALADARATAEAARTRVVKITAAFAGDSPVTKHGFGYIAGERDGFLYITTANHVVRSDIEDVPAAATKVQFFSDQGVSYPALVLETHRRAPLDLAVLKVARPGAFPSPPLCDDGQSIARNLPAVYVGRDGEWYVPTGDGIVNSDAPDVGSHFEVDFARTVAVKEGTSGAPLVSERGLLGMIIQDSNSNVATVLAIDAVARALRDWNHPWAAQSCSTPPPPPPRPRNRGFELGFRSGFGHLAGDLSQYHPGVSDKIDGVTVPLILEGGYHLSPSIIVGMSFSYDARVPIPSDECQSLSMLRICSGTDVIVGALARYRRPVTERFDVWGGLGAGYEWLSIEGDAGYYDRYRGFEYARLELGGDIIVTDRVTIGPFASFSISQFDLAEENRGDCSMDGACGRADLAGDGQRAPHYWLVLGLRMGIAITR